MKKIIPTLLLFISSITPILASTPSGVISTDTIKVVSYNIWNGFTESEDKRELFVEYMKGLSPDVVGYQELCGFTQEKLSALAKEIGHDYAIIHKENGYPVGISSNQPIELIEKRMEGYGHGMLHAKTYGLDMIVTHLNPHSVLIRRKEARNITNYLAQKNISTKVIVMGDLNDHSPSDADQLQLQELTNPEQTRGGVSDDNTEYSVISTFISYPLMDICQKYVAPQLRETFPTLVFFKTDKERKTRYPNRMDFILVSLDLEAQIVDAAILNRGQTDYISDHYPISMDIVVTK